MEQFIGCDAHKKFSLFVAMNERGEYGRPVRVSHEREHMQGFLADLPAGSQIALETSGSYYWLVEEMERAGHQPCLAHALRAKQRMQGMHKSDERDARGLAMLLRNGTLPRIWIPPRQLRDERELLRFRMSLVEMRSRLKNRIHGILMRYNVVIETEDLYGREGRQQLAQRLEELPSWTRESVRKQLEAVDFLDREITACEQLLSQMLEANAERDLLVTMPGIGKILSAVIALEVGDIGRFPSCGDFASYAGVVQSADISAEKRHKSKCPSACNYYLKWAFIEAGNVIAMHRHRWPERHVARLYERIKRKTGLHGKATVAVGRHLAESTYWMLTKQELYREPKSKQPAPSSRQG
jgi:transposase